MTLSQGAVKKRRDGRVEGGEVVERTGGRLRAAVRRHELKALNRKSQFQRFMRGAKGRGQDA